MFVIIFHGNGKVLDEIFELTGADPINKIVKSLTLSAVGLVVTNKTFYRVGNTLGGDADFQTFADARTSVVIVAAEHDNVAWYLVVIEFQRRPIETNVGDVMSTTAIGATTHL